MALSPPPRAPLAVLLGCVTLLVASAGDPPGSPRRRGEEQQVSFNRDVRPLFSNRCFHCHGPDEHDRKGKLRLDRADGPDGAYRVRGGTQAIKPGRLPGAEKNIEPGVDEVTTLAPS